MTPPVANRSDCLPIFDISLDVVGGVTQIRYSPMHASESVALFSLVVQFVISPLLRPESNLFTSPHNLAGGLNQRYYSGRMERPLPKQDISNQPERVKKFHPLTHSRHRHSTSSPLRCPTDSKLSRVIHPSSGTIHRSRKTLT
jgi:hypothetical protein